MGFTAPGTRSGVQSTPNVTPMIDVMLVLLIIFMLVVPAIDARARLPEAAAAAARPQRTEDRTLTVDAAGAYWIDGARVPDASLERELARLASARADDRVLYVKADASLDYGVVSRTVDAARRSGFVVVGMVTTAVRDRVP